MKKLIIVLMAVVVISSYAHTTEVTNLSGLQKLKTNWYKLTHHESKFKIEKDCNNNPETISIREMNDKLYLIHQVGNRELEYEILICAIRPTNNSVDQTLDLQLQDSKSGKVTNVVVRYSLNQTLWYGLTNTTSSHRFTSEETFKSFDSIIPTCE